MFFNILLLIFSLLIPVSYSNSMHELNSEQIRLLKEQAISDLRSSSQDELDGLLLEVSKAGDYKKINMLFKVVDRKYFSDSAMHNAVIEAFEKRHAEAIRALFRHGAPNVDMQQDNGFSMLMVASAEGNRKLVRALLKSKAAVDLVDNNKLTALFHATNMCRPEIIYDLRRAGATVDLCDQDGRTPLMSASRAGFLPAVRVLVGAGAKVNLKDDDGDSALSYAIECPEANMSAFLTDYFIRHGANIYSQNMIGDNALIAAAVRGNVGAAKHIVAKIKKEKPEEINSRDFYGCTALIKSSVSDNSLAIAKYLLSQGADIELCNDEGFNVLQAAREHSSPETVEFLSNVLAMRALYKRKDKITCRDELRAKYKNI